MQLRRLVACLAMFLAAGCAVPAAPIARDAVRDPEAVDLPPAAYSSVAWMGDGLIAFSRLTDPLTANVTVVDAIGQEVASFELPAEGACILRTADAFTMLPTGELGFSAGCIHQAGKSSELFAYDIARGARSLGNTAVRAGRAAWTPDMSSAIYAADFSLCTTLFVRNGDDRPMPGSVSIRGQPVPLGEDVRATPDGCTRFGQADWPALSPDGAILAAFVMAAGGASGRDRIDLPWALVLREGDEARVLLDGIHYPGGVGWLSSTRLVFSGTIGSARGLWVINRDGTDLAQVGDIALDYFSVDQEHRVLGIVSDPDRFERLERGEMERNEVVLFDLRAIH